jgi:hypothetical protein
MNSAVRIVPWILILAAMAAAFTAWAVDRSHEQGRLSSVPIYDDAVYFLSGTQILEAFRSDGWSGVSAAIRTNGLHAPFSTALASIAYATAGYHDAAPYAWNGVVVALYLGLLASLLWSIPLAARLVLLAFYLTIPFATMAVVEFRPDLCWSVLVGFCGVFGVTSRGYFRDWRLPLAHGLFFALALLVKPSTFAMTLIVFGWSVVCRFAIEWAVERRAPVRALPRLVAMWLAVTVVVAGPYWFFFGRETWIYFWQNSFGTNKAIWAYSGGILDKLGYYIAGEGALSNLGWMGWLLVLLFVAAGTVSFRLRDRWSLAETVALAGLVLVTFGINTIAGMKSPFLGGAFYASLIFGSAASLATLARAVKAGMTRSARVAAVSAMILLAAGMLLYQWPRYSAAVASERGRNFRHVEEQVVEALKGLPVRENPVLLFTHSGPLIRENIVRRYLQQRRPVRGISMSFYQSENEFSQALRSADVVFVQDVGVLGSFPNLPAESLQGSYRSILEAHPSFRMVSAAEALDGRQVYIYWRERGRKARREGKSGG